MKLVASLIAVTLLAGCLPPTPEAKKQGPTTIVNRDLEVRYMNDGEGTYLRQICWRGLVFLSGANTLQVMKPNGKPMTCDE